jgi:hypothetical protein
MENGNILGVRSTVVSLPRSASRDQRVTRAIQARGRLRSPRGGRAWINGREVGGPDPRFAHLSATYD